MPLSGRLAHLFRRDEDEGPRSDIRERWEASFLHPLGGRFAQERAETYEIRVHRRRLTLSANKRSLFAWTTADSRRYRDFAVEADVEFGPDNGYSAAGLVLRHLGDENFYYFLLSNRGTFRFDLVFNGTPVPLITWTPSPAIQVGINRIRIIGRDRHFSFYVGDEWVGEIDDETLAEGALGFAGQNFDERSAAKFTMSRFHVESRPVEVERAYLLWTEYVPVDPLRRLELAKSFYRRAESMAAVVQLKKGLKNRRGTAEEYALLGECLVDLRTYEPALGAVEKALELDPGLRRAAQEKGTLLYLLGRQEEAARHLRKVLSDDEQSVPLWNILGNAEYALGRWAAALDAYERALALEPGNPLIRVNAARSLEALGRNADAIGLYLEAARDFVRQGARDDLAQLLPRLERLGAEKQQLLSLEAKMLYVDGRLAEAEPVLRGLITEAFDDSSLWYLLAHILSGRGERGEARELLRRACEMEPDCSLYHMRLAENLHLMGEDAEEELRTAYRLTPEDPWVNNLYGQILMSRGDWGGAEPYLEKAFRVAPDESAVLINYSECMAAAGNLPQAADLVSRRLEIREDAPLVNQLGNLLVRGKDYAGALERYEQALRLAPNDSRYAKNAAAACIELDMIQKAEELLAGLEERSPEADVYNLIGHVALIQGQYDRAEASLRRGLELAPSDEALLVNLASLALARRSVDEARGVLESILEGNPDCEPALQLRNRIRRDFEEDLRCDCCGNTWRVPAPLPAQPSLRIVGEPPDECPAGKCSVCGRILCIKCARGNLRNGRLHCDRCDGALKLSDDRLKYLVSRYVGR